ncbi:hypothetical protein Nisw_01415 [Candidatus Nitrosopumilus sp. SW]|uniref:hypothetical protein n=1 Tax=Candidatus Nitrosopumilus sp. SW TaxID=2508726 RepID=UPI00114FCAF0|nr:hypothetical protein [Candidatus Nitrosopumilus sp. SW]QDI88282.1 hypothetical protein Nisw_01415 [Candidatus Nitrosopumilus sp. SW]
MNQQLTTSITTEKELLEMNRLKRLELEFLFFRSKMDNSVFQKFHDALPDENHILKEINSEIKNFNEVIEH